MQNREKNARILASEPDKEMTESEIDKKIQEYYENYDSETDSEERTEFEQMAEHFLMTSSRSFLIFAQNNVNACLNGAGIGETVRKPG